MNSYSDFAYVYDSLMHSDIDYEKWADYIENLFDMYGVNPDLVCDLACGTGNITIPLARRGYNITHRARQITQTDFFRFDLIIGMDADNQRALQQLAPAQTAHKIRTAVSYCDKFRHADAVPDPYYGGDAGFEYAIDLLEDACDGIIATLRH